MHRFTTLSWRQSVRLRQYIAFFLVLIGIGSLFYQPRSHAYIATRTLSPGHMVEEGDFIYTAVDPLPENSVRTPPQGRITTMGYSPGQIAVEHGFLGSDFAELFAGYELVPISLAHPDHALLLNSGDSVTVIAQHEGEAIIIVDNAYIAVASQPQLLLAIVPENAMELAAASLNYPLNIIVNY